MNFAANRVSGPARASRNINDALQSSGTNRGAVADAMARNPELMPLDVDPALFARAQGIATQPGPGRGVIEDAVNARSTRAGAAVSGAFDEALGSAPNVRVLLEIIQQRVRNVGVQFDPLLAQAGSVDVRAIVAAIDRRLPNGWQFRHAGSPPPRRQPLIGASGRSPLASTVRHRKGDRNKTRRNVPHGPFPPNSRKIPGSAIRKAQRPPLRTDVSKLHPRNPSLKGSAEHSQRRTMTIAQQFLQARSSTRLDSTASSIGRRNTLA